MIPLTGKHHEINTDTAYVNVLTRGDLSSLHWIESPLKYFDPAEHPDQQLCRVHYAALNFRDIMLATGKLPPDAIPGIYFHINFGSKSESESGSVPDTDSNLYVCII